MLTEHIYDAGFLFCLYGVAATKWGRVNGTLRTAFPTAEKTANHQITIDGFLTL